MTSSRRPFTCFPIIRSAEFAAAPQLRFNCKFRSYCNQFFRKRIPLFSTGLFQARRQGSRRKRCGPETCCLPGSAPRYSPAALIAVAALHSFYLLRFVCCVLFAAVCFLLFVSCVLFVAFCLLRFVCCVLFVAFCLLRFVYCALFAAVCGFLRLFRLSGFAGTRQFPLPQPSRLPLRESPSPRRKRHHPLQIRLPDWFPPVPHLRQCSLCD